MNEWVWSNGGMILTGENWSTGRKTLYSVGFRWMNEYGAMVEWYWQGPARPRPTALLSPSSDGKPEAATAVVVAPDDGHEDARNMLSCI